MELVPGAESGVAQWKEVIAAFLVAEESVLDDAVVMEWVGCLDWKW